MSNCDDASFLHMSVCMDVAKLPPSVDCASGPPIFTHRRSQNRHSVFCHRTHRHPDHHVSHGSMNVICILSIAIAAVTCSPVIAQFSCAALQSCRYVHDKARAELAMDCIKKKTLTADCCETSCERNLCTAVTECQVRDLHFVAVANSKACSSSGHMSSSCCRTACTGKP